MRISGRINWSHIWASNEISHLPISEVLDSFSFRRHFINKLIISITNIYMRPSDGRERVRVRARRKKVQSHLSNSTKRVCLLLHHHRHIQRNTKWLLLMRCGCVELVSVFVCVCVYCATESFINKFHQHQSPYQNKNYYTCPASQSINTFHLLSFTEFVHHIEPNPL